MRRTGGVVLALLLFGTTASAQLNNRIITTVAGGGPDQVHISNTPLSARSLFFDAAGNLWAVTEYTANHRGPHFRVFWIDASGIVTVRAGSGFYEFDGDGGPATQAGLHPLGAALDSAGNLLIADGNNRIRRVVAATGLIETVAGTGAATGSIDGPGGNPADDLGDGGPAATASVGPSSLTIDPAGNIVFSDGNRIRRIDVATGIITTIVGTGFYGFNGDGIDAASASLSNPGEIQYDAHGNLYIADTGNNRVRRVDAATHLISTAAGNGWNTGSIDGEGGNPSDDLGDGRPATTATINLPPGIRLDAAGNLFIADDNQRIRRVDVSSGIITTVAGNGLQGGVTDGVAATSTTLSLPSSVAIDSGNNLFIATNGRIRRIDSSTGIITSISGDPDAIHGDGELATRVALNLDTAGLAFGPGGDLFVGMYGSVRRVDAATGRLSTVAWCNDLVASCYSGGGSPAPPNISLLDAAGLAFGPGGDLFIANGFANQVLRVDRVTQAISVVAGNGYEGASGDGGPATQAAVGYPVALAFDAAGNLYIAQNGTDYYYYMRAQVRRIDATTGLISTVAGGGGHSSADGNGRPATTVLFDYSFGGLALDTAGNIFVSEDPASRVWRVDAATGLLSIIAGTGFNYPWGLTVDTDGGLLVADSGHFRIARIDLSTGIVSTVAGTGVEGFRGDGGPPTEARLALVYNLASRPNGEIAIADSGISRVRLITAPQCLAPGAPVFITNVRRDINNFPVLDFQDGNPASQATGYHIYRSSNAAIPPGSWPRVGFNVPDMDAGTPNMQWVDSSGDPSPSGIWYYNVTAYNSNCNAEGPF